MAACSSQRVLIVLVIVLSIVTVALVAVMVWRETRDEEMAKITKENLIKLYPSNFRTDEQQTKFLQQYEDGINNRTEVTGKIPVLNETCSFSCFNNYPTRRRKRSIAGVYHGCCVSTVQFVSPPTKSNIFGASRNLVQFPDARQYFGEHNCNSVQGCTGCVCSQENNLHTAIVFKSAMNLDDAEYIEDTEIDLFYFSGCCKCINT